MATRSNTLVWIALGALAALPPPARAQTTATVDAYTGRTCAGTRYTKDLGCTSNDFTTTATFTQPPPGRSSCVAGETITLDVITNIVSNSPTRYDGAVFLGERGNDPSLADSTQTCSLGVFPGSPSPFLDLDGDLVGDFQSTSTASLTIKGAVAYCQPVAGSNVLGLPYTLVFDNQDKDYQSYTNVTAGGPAKCVNTLAAQVTGVIVQGWVEITVQTVPGADPQAFPFTTSGTATASPATFSLAAGQTQLVQVPLSPTGGTQTLQLDETLVPGWVSTAAITCTNPTGGAAPYVVTDGANRRITATLDATNHGARCTITNTKLARVTVREQTAGDVGAFTFASGTNGLPASFTLDTTAPNPNPATGGWSVTANGAAVSLSQTAMPAGWTFTSVECRDASNALVGAVAGASVSIAAAEVTPGRNVTCTFANTRKATLTKAFSPVQTGTGVPSTLTFTVTNRPGAPAQAGLGFTDAFPAGLRVASPLAVSSTCGGTLSRAGTAIPLAAGDAGVTLSGGALALGTAACTISVAVSAPAVGTYTNGPAQMSGYAGGVEGGVTDQPLTVYPLPNLLMVKSASPASVKPGDVVTYTVFVRNSGPGVANAVVLTDPISRYLAWGVNAYGPGVSFDLAGASGLALGAPEYSSDGGATWTLVPASGGGGAAPGYDGRVTNWRLPLTGTMAAGGELTLTFQAMVR